jgi:hypothetical protein
MKELEELSCRETLRLVKCLLMKESLGNPMTLTMMKTLMKQVKWGSLVPVGGAHCDGGGVLMRCVLRSREREVGELVGRLKPQDPRGEPVDQPL